MTQGIPNGSGGVVLPINQLIKLGSGYEVISGCGAILANSSTDIQVTVNEGRIRHDNEEVIVPKQTATLQPGDSENPRQDVIWVNRFGEVEIAAGEARPTVPSDRSGREVFSPPPTSGATLDGVPVAAVWVPAGATSSDELTNTANVFDLRVGGVVGGAYIPFRDDDPAQNELYEPRMWFNASAASGEGQYRVYNPEADAIYSLDTTLENSFTGESELIIERFESDLDDNWRGGESEWIIRDPAFEGDFAGYYDGGSTTYDYSLPGDGLERYPDIGDTISLAVIFESGTLGRYGAFAFGKESDEYDEEYNVRLNIREDELRLVRVDSGLDDNILSSLSVSLEYDTWYIIEGEYDGGGEGVHPYRVWSTANGARDTILAEETAPPADTTYRGRGVGVQADSRTPGLDRLALM